MSALSSRRLVLTLLGISAVVAVGLFWLLTWQPQREAKLGFEAKALALSELVAYSLRSAAEFGDGEAAQRYLTTASRERSVAYLGVRLVDQSLLAATPGSNIPSLPSNLAAQPVTREDGEVFHVTAPIAGKNGPLGWLQAGFRTAELRASVAHSKLVSLWVAIGIGVVVFLLLYSVMSRAVANRMLLGEIAVTASKLRGSSADIIRACNQLTANANEQSAAVEQTRVTMASLVEAAKRIASTSRQVLDNAEQTNRGTGTAANAIRVLTEQAQRIGEISEAIRSISDKSELLALNASLEGTRAGEAGRGFGLVAVEMRRLAENVTEAAREIKQLSGDIRTASDSSVAAVEEGRLLASRTSESAREITLVTQQQRMATEQVTRSMEEVNQILTRSMESTAQTERSALDLVGRADELSSLTARFTRTVRAEDGRG